MTVVITTEDSKLVRWNDLLENIAQSGLLLACEDVDADLRYFCGLLVVREAHQTLSLRRASFLI